MDSLWVVLLLTSSFCLSYSAKDVRRLTSDQANQINSGLTLGKELGDFMKSTDFQKSLTQLTKSIGPYLGVVGPVVSFVLGFVGTQESAELQAIKRLAVEVDRRFDQVDSQFADVKRLIDWNTIKVQFSTHEQKIHAVANEYNLLTRVPKAAFPHQKDIFISNYESDYQNSGFKLYDGIMNEGNLFGDGLLVAAMKFTQHDRRQCQTFMLGLLKLLLTASKLELAYLELKGHTASQAFYTNEWKTKFYHIRAKMEQADRTIVSKYHEQMKIDLEKFSMDHPSSKMNHEVFTNTLYGQLSAKYYWRDWLVIAYNDVSGFQYHKLRGCGGALKLRSHGRNFFVASVDKNHPHINQKTANSEIDNVLKRIPKNYFGSIQFTNAQVLFDQFSDSTQHHCSPYAGFAVIRGGIGEHYRASANRLVIRPPNQRSFLFENIFMFG